MNAKELFYSDGVSAGLFVCDKCGSQSAHKEHVDGCCTQCVCRTCGTAVDRWRQKCNGCEEKEIAAAEAARFENAEKVTSCDGFVFCEGFGQDGYCDSLGQLLEEIEDASADVERPKYAWVCEPRGFVSVDFSDIVDRFRDEAWEDFDEYSLHGVAEFKAAIAAFEGANAGVVAYHPDYSRAVLIPEKEGGRDR